MNIYPDWLLQGVTGGGGGTAIASELDVELMTAASVSIETEVTAELDLIASVPIDAGELSVVLEGEVTIELDVCK